MRRITLWLMIFISSCALAPASAAEWQDLIGGNLTQWEVLGDGIWRLRSDGVITAHRLPDKKYLEDLGDRLTLKDYHNWEIQQSWLYTNKEYEEYDLRLDYWVRTPGNSGISIRDPTRAKYSLTIPPDYSKTPSKVGYEIQINSDWPDKNPTGSIYGLAAGAPGVERVGEWNTMNIESRRGSIRIFINGVLAAEHAGDPKRPTKGPIGLQLHDQASVVMFRNIWIRELP